MDYAAVVAKAAAAKPMPFTNVPAPQEGLVVHVDGDYCAYFCAGNDDTEAGQARRNLLSRIDRLKHVSGATSAIVHLTDRASTKGDRFIAATVKPYQGQRNSGRKPRNWEALREYMEGYDADKFRVKVWKEREADDGIAYVAHSAAQAGKLAVIATADKDMRMLPGRHVIWKTLQLHDVPFKTFESTGPDDELYGHKWFWMQMLMGDTADNIPGLPKYLTPGGGFALVGKATATRLMQDVHNNDEAFRTVAGMYQGYYDEEWSDRFAEQATLLWLRTDRYAEIGNFLEATPQGGVIVAAAERLRQRIKDAKEEAQQYAS